MQKTTKMIYGLAMAITAFGAFTSASSAAPEHEVILSYTRASLDTVIAVTDEDDEVSLLNLSARGSGFILNSRGIYDSGFRYNLSYTDVGLDTVNGVELNANDFEFGVLKLRYVPFSIGDTAVAFGPAINYADAAYLDDQFLIGASAEYFVGDVEVRAVLTTEVDNMFDDIILEVGGRYDVSDRVTLVGEVGVGWFENLDTITELNVALRYNILDHSFLQAGYGTTLGLDDIDLRSYSLGFGLYF